MINPLFVAAILGVSVGFQPAVSKELVSPETGQTKLQVGLLSEPLEGQLSQAAQDWALGQREVLGVPVRSTLRAIVAQGTWFGASIRLQQQIDGVDVYAAQVVVTVNKDRRVTIVSSSALKFEQAIMGWKFAPDAALLSASKVVPLAMLQSNGKPYGGARREIFPVGADAHAGYLLMVPTLNPADNWIVAVDATTGTVLWKQNRVFRASQDANVYASSPGGLDGGVGVTPTILKQLDHDDGGSMVLPGQGGYLNGTQLTAYNCCVNQSCSLAPDAGSKRQMGMINFMGFPVSYNVAVCDRLQRATNDVLVHDAGSYEYPPIDPPLLNGVNPGPVVQSDLSHSDEFAEVHAFYQINRIYDWVRGLSSAAAPLFPTGNPDGGPVEPFKMRDERRFPPRKPAVWANVMFPDIEALQTNPGMYCTFMPPLCKIDVLGRIDNAAFLPREQFAGIPLPAYQMDVDTLMIFQGNRADFAYDAPVLWHEFGHGVVYATAALTFDTLALDARSANNETGAMHEGFADFIAGAFGQDPEIGTYVGPRTGAAATVMGVRQDSYLRSMQNSLTCPSVLWGEVHQDSQHYSAALWQARQTQFLGTDNGRTFDAAFYASLVAMSPQVDFAAAAIVIAMHVNDAFPSIPSAGVKMQDIFAARGITNCNKVLDITNTLSTPRPYYGISQGGAAGLSMGTVVPGPHQFKIKTPLGMKSLTVTARVPPMNMFTPGAVVKLFARANGPITFVKSNNSLITNADLIVDGVNPGSTMTATANLAIPCGSTSEVDFTLGSPQGDQLQNVVAFFLPADSCNPVTDGGNDGGTNPDGGTDGGAPKTDGGSDGGGTQVVTLGWIGGVKPGPAAPTGCGCSVEAGVGGLVALMVLLLRRRRQY